VGNDKVFQPGERMRLALGTVSDSLAFVEAEENL
jgi:hypothetical protein